MITESPPSIDKHGVNRDLDKKHWCLPYHLTQSSMGAGTLNLGDSAFLYTGNHWNMAIHWSLTPLFEVDYRSSWNKGIEQAYYSPEKWLYNRVYCPSNRSKQIQETHTAYSAGTQYTRQSLNEKQHTWPHRQTDSYELSSVKPCMLFSIQTLPRVLWAGAISRVSFLDLFGPIARAINPIT